jgi:hypothetical protein
VFCYCPEHKHFIYMRHSKDRNLLDFFAKAGEKARNCREFKFLLDC